MGEEIYLRIGWLLADSAGLLHGQGVGGYRLQGPLVNIVEAGMAQHQNWRNYGAGGKSNHDCHQPHGSDSVSLQKGLEY